MLPILAQRPLGEFFSVFIISVLKHGAKPWLSLLHIHSTICSPDISAVCGPLLKYRLIGETDTTASLWLSNNTCFADDAMHPLLHWGKLCAAVFRFADAGVLMNIDTGVFREHVTFKITCVPCGSLCSTSSFWESPPFTFGAVVNALLNTFPVCLYPH